MIYENLIIAANHNKKGKIIYFIILKEKRTCWITFKESAFGFYFCEGHKFLSIEGLEELFKRNDKYYLDTASTSACSMCGKIGNFKNSFTVGANSLYLHKECALKLKNVLETKIPEKLKPKIIAKSI